MDFLNILETFGLPVFMVLALGWYVNKQNKWIQNELNTEMRETAARHESIIVKLIEAQKKTQENQAKINTKLSTTIEIMRALSGNGLRDKFNQNKIVEDDW